MHHSNVNKLMQQYTGTLLKIRKILSRREYANIKIFFMKTNFFLKNKYNNDI